MSGPAVDSAQGSSIKPQPRKLIVCIDGTANQFSEKVVTVNTNVVELYNRIIKDSTQLTYYNSGIGTFPRPFEWSFAYFRNLPLSLLDSMFAEL
ncbi:hypothetical protein FRC12_016863 [Ceratobasidium sp. 428]|nr:hypothetical protein FRC12_016863 [Ceratobasidium sp. 428]